jgi:hypothetical protein
MFSEPNPLPTTGPRDALIHELAETIRQQAQRIAEQDQRIAELLDKQQELLDKQQEREALIEKLQELLKTKVEAKTSKTPVFTENYSLDRNPRQPKKTKKKSTGRKPAAAKQSQVTRRVNLYAEGVDPKECVRHRAQLAWRIFDGQAVYVCYHIYDLPDSQNLPLPWGLRNSRSEYGIEIILILAFLHYWIGVSIDHARQIMEFFTGLVLSKSQADSLLTQLAADWDAQYDTIAELIALQMIVYIDETGWKVGEKSCYTWVFSTALHVLYRCGVTRQKSEATHILGDSFEGIGVTDNYAAYKDLFSQHQLCWAHLIRKAIKLALQNPAETEYAEFLDQLCLIYHDAKGCRDACQSDTMSASNTIDTSNPVDTSNTVNVVKSLQGRVQALCDRVDEPVVTAKAAAKAVPPIAATEIHLAAFILLQRELLNQLDCLFVFVEHPEVEPTNNRSERNIRREAEIRKGARTNKSAAGAKRRSIIVTVFASLATRISHFTLSAMLDEIEGWCTRGTSLFQQELAALKASLPPPDSAHEPSKTPLIDSQIA